MEEKNDLEPEISTESAVDPHCVACDMPMRTPEEHGTNADGSKCEEYCAHCMVGGEKK